MAFSEKSPCWIELVARGRGGHGSAASGDGAIPTLVAALERVRRMEPPVRVTPEVARMFAALAPYAAPEDRAGLAHLEASLAEDPAFRARFLAERGRAALVRSTLEITVLESGGSTNVVPAEARAQIDARLLPGERCDEFVEQRARGGGDARPRAAHPARLRERAPRASTPICSGPSSAWPRAASGPPSWCRG